MEDRKMSKNNKNNITMIPSKYIKGGVGYQKNSTKEISEFIKANPKRFLKGVGLLGVGAGMASFAAKSAYNKVKGNK